MPERKVTTDHGIIRRWVEEREGKPATVRGTGGDTAAGVLRVDFPGNKASRTESLSWDEFFRKFDEKRLAFLYQEKTSDGKLSRFCKFTRRDAPEGGGGSLKPPKPEAIPEEQSRWEDESPAAARVPGGGLDEDLKPSIGEGPG